MSTAPGPPRPIVQHSQICCAVLRSFMALLSLRDVSLAFGGPRLLDHVDWQIERGERICLLGRNGEGKSTLLRLVEGRLEPDEGAVIRQQGLRIARLVQEVPEGRGGTVADEVAAGLEPDEAGHDADPHDHRVDAVISRMGLDAGARFCALLGDEAARAPGAGRWSPTRTSSCSTSRPTTWTSSRSDGSRTSCSATSGRWSSSRTTGRSSRGWPPGSPSSTAAGSTTGPATTRRSSSARSNCSPPRSVRRPSSTRSWPRKRPGSARASRPAAPATRAASGR